MLPKKGLYGLIVQKPFIRGAIRLVYEDFIPSRLSA
jgi:hypothetical protein